ncbi:MAG: bifunctional acetate--CoA ligase family protein/GNAT family N-acetyltransferase [Deltaproteobacteria bacterium]|nr:bifunctional acetate--CoA ligase family protein/GNAT family N-acetyltransferase [Deltaproteobacteria bacterium]
MGVRNLESLFKPSSVAVVGATPKESAVGHAVLKNLIDAGFEGPIYPINPKHSELLGRTCYPSLSAVGQRIELVVIAVPIAMVPAVVEEAGNVGCRAAIVISAGGREVGAEGLQIENRILEVAARAGIRMLGPNCLGIIVPDAKLNASFAAHTCYPGEVALVSQSGAICTIILDRAMEAKIGFSHFVSIGSMADVDFADLIDYLGSDPKVTSIVIYIEAIKNVRKFMSATRAVSRVKPIIVVKAGRSDAGAKAAASHTGSLVGDDEVYDAAFARAGIIRVRKLIELFDCAEALAKQGRPRGPRVAILTNAGGPGVMTADALKDWDRTPAELSPETIRALDEVLPPAWSHGDPVDILGDAPAERYRDAAKVLLSAPEVDSVIVLLAPQAMTDATAVAREIVPVIQEATTPACAVWMGGPSVARGVELLHEAGVPVFETPERAVNTLMYMFRYSHNLGLLQETPPNFPANLPFDRNLARVIVDSALARGQLVLTETEAKALLAAYRIPVNRTEVATSEALAAERAGQLGYPVVLKIHSRDITHKTEAKGIQLNLHNAQDVRSAYRRVLENARAYKPDAHILGVTLQPMLERVDYEVIVGSKKDPDFGPTILFGMGGILTEVLRDKAIGLPPMNLLLARRLIESTKIFQLLRGYRNRPAANLPLLEEVIVRLAYLVTDCPEVAELDINPLALSGQQVVAVDARAVLEPVTVKSPDHLVIRPYPTQYETHWVMENGTPVLLRPVRPEDEPMLQEFFGGLSAETLYFRFFHLIKSMRHDQLARFCQVDYDREIALVAVEEPPGREKVLALCHLYVQPAWEEAEFAVVVGDPYQRQGLGRRISSFGMELVKQKGIQRITGVVLPENEGMLSLAKKLGFTAIRDLGEGVYRIEHEIR